MKKVFTKKHMVVLEATNNGATNYIVINTKKQFEEGHTHIRTYEQALYLVDCILKNKIPKKCNKYFLESLIRLATNKKYIEQVQARLNGDKQFNSYHNTPKKFRK